VTARLDKQDRNRCSSSTVCSKIRKKYRTGVISDDRVLTKPTFSNSRLCCYLAGFEGRCTICSQNDAAALLHFNDVSSSPQRCSKRYMHTNRPREDEWSCRSRARLVDRMRSIPGSRSDHAKHYGVKAHQHEIGRLQPSPESLMPSACLVSMAVPVIAEHRRPASSRMIRL
jgi:hypothetical protein